MVRQTGLAVLHNGVFFLTVLLILMHGNLSHGHGEAHTPWAAATYLKPLDNPARGVFLVASRDMPDPRFQRTVILLLEHGENGTVGLVINRPTEVSLAEILPDLPQANDKSHVLFWGGPVALHTLMFLMQSKLPLDHGIPVLDNVYVSAHRLTLKQLLDEHKPAPQVRIYTGHAGWAPGQLDAELATGGWRLFEATSELLFHDKPTLLWEKLINQEGQMMVRNNVPAKAQAFVNASMQRVVSDSGMF
jgi:putative transcriptional regulator